MAIKPIRSVTKTITPAGTNLVLLDDGVSMGKATLTDTVTVVASPLADSKIAALDLDTASQKAVEFFATAAQGAAADSAMQPATYDPGGIADNAFDRTKHTGVMPNTGLQSRLREHVWNNLVSDWNSALQTGFYGGANAANGPTTSYYAGTVIAADGSGNRICQTVYRYANRADSNTETWQRTGQYSGGSWSFSSWYRLRLSETEQQALWDARYVQPGDLGALATKDKVQVADIDATGTPGSTTFYRGDGTWGTPSGGGDLLAANNLSDVASASTSRTNLGLAIGTNVQAYNAKLAALAGMTWVAGDIFYATGANSISKLAIGAAGQLLRTNSGATAPEYADVVTPWVAFTPTFTGLGTVTAISMWSRRVGDTLQVRGKFTVGTPTATEARISFLFNGSTAVNSDATKVPSLQLAGTMATNATGANAKYVLIESNVAYLTVGAQNSGRAALAKVNGNDVIAAGDVVSIQAEIPISGW